MDDLVIQEFVNAIKEDPTETNTTYNATVSRIDNEGVVWVNLHGSEKETPTASTSSEVKRGDAVTVNWRNNKLYIGGNYSNPSVGISTVKPSVDYVTEMISKAITVNSINAATGYIETLESNNITAENISADHAAISTLDTTYATIEELHSGYAEIDLANVNNAWIQNGVVKDAAISDAQIADVSANKLTAGTIDASNINVTNLNADNITAGSITVDGITIDIENNEANIDGAYIEDGTITMNGLAQSVQNAIDGAIETYTGTVVPTLNNSPASSWTTTKLKDSHIGDIYYVINAGHEADGYCYRFAKSGSTYSWVLIQDSDVTAALSRLTTAEGKIEGLESFESETSSWMTDTDEELSSVKSNVTSLTGRMTTAEGNIQQKVDTSTFNTLSQTVDENTADITSLTTITENNGLTSSTNITNTVNQVSQTASGNSSKISQLVTTLGTNADGTTKAGDIVHRTSAVEQDLSGFKTTVAETYATQDEVDGKADASTVYTKSEINQTVSNINSSISSKANSSDVYTKSEINQTVSGINTSISAKADASSVYTKSEIDQTVSGINASVSAKADGQETTAALALKANKDTLTSEINASADTVKINANRVQIDGTATFNAIKSSTDAAYDAKGAAAAVAEDIPTKVSELTNDRGYQTSGQVSSAISTATSDMATNTSVANTYATKAAANAQEQLIYKSAVSGTTSMSGTTTWITSTSDTQNAWTTKRPTYNSSYPVLFIATQRKSVSGTVTCTTPIIDDTTTIIDGGHIITGTVTANQIASAAVTADKLAANSITVGKMDEETQAMMPWTSDVESVPYLLRQSAGGTIDHDFTGEYDKIVGGTVAWNQLMTSNYSANSSRGTALVNGTTIVAGHKYLITRKLSASVSVQNSIYTYLNGANSVCIYISGTQREKIMSATYGGVSNGTAANVAGNVWQYQWHATSDAVTVTDLNIFDLTQMFGSTIADYIYNLETTTAGAGVAFFKKLFPNDYYAYDAGTLRSVEGLSEHVMRDADDNIIGEYPLDSSLTLRGIPKLNGNNLYYDGDTYESDGTVTRKYGVLTFDGSSDENWVAWQGCYAIVPAFVGDNITLVDPLICSAFTYIGLYNAAPSGMAIGEFLANMPSAGIWNRNISFKHDNLGDVANFRTWLASNPIQVLYPLKTPTTETATSYASPQAVIPQGTEEYVTTGIVPVGHETTYASGSTVNAGIVASAQINSAIQDTQSYTDDVTSTLSDSLTESISQTSTELSGKIDEVRTLANSKADSSALNNLSLQMQEYIGEGGYIYAQNGTLIIATGQNIGNFKIGLTGQQIVFYENDVAVAYIEGKKMYITRSEVTDEQKISNFAFKKRDGGRFTLMYVGG